MLSAAIGIDVRAVALHGCSGCSPGVVDHEPPGAVRLAPEDVRVARLQPDRFAVRAGAVERPCAGDEREVVDLEDP